MRPGCPIEGHFDGNRDLPFDLFRGPAGKLGDQLDHRRRRVGIGDDVEVRNA